MNNYHGIKSFYEFSYEEWSDREDKELEFPIQSYVSDIEIAFQSQVLLQNGKYVTLNSNHNIFIDLGHGNEHFLDLYLEKNEKYEHIINVLGLNGQKSSHVNVLVNFSAEGISEEESFSLSTDSNGQINLGLLRYVKNIDASIKVTDSVIRRRWRINSSNDTSLYPSKVYCELGSEFRLAVDKEWTNKHVAFYTKIKDTLQRNLSDQIKVENGKLTLPIFSERPAEDTKFYIYLLPLDLTIELEFILGRKLSKQAEKSILFDQQRKKVTAFAQNKYRAVKLQSAKTELKDNKHILNLDLNVGSLSEEEINNLRIHVMPTNFISPPISTVDLKNLNGNDQVEKYTLNPKYSTYYSNKTLSEEGAYAEKRQK